MRRRRAPEIIAGRVNLDGSIATGDGFTVQKTATGTYVITFPASFRLVAATAGMVAGGEAVSTGTYTGSGFTASPLTAAGAVVDASFTFIAYGVQQ